MWRAQDSEEARQVPILGMAFPFFSSTPGGRGPTQVTAPSSMNRFRGSRTRDRAVFHPGAENAQRTCGLLLAAVFAAVLSTALPAIAQSYASNPFDDRPVGTVTVAAFKTSRRSIRFSLGFPLPAASCLRPVLQASGRPSWAVCAFTNCRFCTLRMHRRFLSFLTRSRQAVLHSAGSGGRLP